VRCDVYECVGCGVWCVTVYFVVCDCVCSVCGVCGVCVCMCVWCMCCVWFVCVALITQHAMLI